MGKFPSMTAFRSLSGGSRMARAVYGFYGIVLVRGSPRDDGFEGVPG